MLCEGGLTYKEKSYMVSNKVYKERKKATWWVGIVT